MDSRSNAHLSGRALLLLAVLAAMPPACKPNGSQPPTAAPPEAVIPSPITGQAVLDQLLGEWTYECVSKAGNGPESRTTGRASYARILGGGFLQEAGEGADNSHGLRLFTYDEQQKCYLTWFFSRNVQTDLVTVGQWDETNQVLNWTQLPGKGSMIQHCFPNRETFTASVLLNDDAGSTFWKGGYTFVRVKDSNKPNPVNIESSSSPSAQSPEQKVLDRLLGTWHQETIGFKALWNPEENHTTGTYKFIRVLDGSFIQETGTDAEGNSVLILYTYDQQHACYRIWNFGSNYGGPRAPATGTWNEAAQAIELNGPKDQEPAYSGRLHFVDANTVVSTCVMNSRAGEVLMNMEFRMTRIDGNPQSVNDQSVKDAVTSTTYRLISIDGQPVPCSPLHDGQRAPEVSGGSMIISSDGTFRGEIKFTDPRVVGPGGAPGTYTREGNILTMKHPGAGYTQGTLDGDQFTMNNEGMLFVYQE